MRSYHWTAIECYGIEGDFFDIRPIAKHHHNDDYLNRHSTRWWGNYIFLSRNNAKIYQLDWDRFYVLISAVDQITNEQSEQSDDGVTKPPLTGIPQIDYVWDPNLPRELNG